MNRIPPYWGVLLVMVLAGVVGLSAVAAIGSPVLSRQPPPMDALTDAPSSTGQLTDGRVNATSSIASPGATAWPMAGANAAQTRHLDTAGPTDPVTRRWRRPVDPSFLFAGAAVRNGTVFLGAGEKVYAMDAWSGERRWSFPTNGSARTPAVFRDTVYVNSRSGNMYALDATTGDVFWQFKSGKVGYAPIVASRTVYVGADDTIYALDALTGKERWAYHLGNRKYHSLATRVAVSDGTVYVGAKYGQVVALDGEDGTERWTSHIPGRKPWPRPPTVADGMVYFGTVHSRLYALDEQTGDIRWHHNFTRRGAVRQPAVADGALYIGTRRGSVFSLDAETGDVLWHVQPDGRPASPTVVNDTVYVAHGGSISLLDPETGTTRTTFTHETSDARTASAPVVVNGSLYVGYDLGEASSDDDLTRFSMYAMGTPVMTYANLSVSEQTVEVDESLTVAVEVTNEGTGPGSFDATLAIDGTDAATKSDTLTAGSQTTLTFTLKFPETGTHTIEIAGLTRTITVGSNGQVGDTTPSPDDSTATPSASDETDESQTVTPTPAAESTPGFGISIAIVAVAFGIVVFAGRG